MPKRKTTKQARKKPRAAARRSAATAFPGAAPTDHVVTKPAQRRALRSPVRLEIIDHLDGGVARSVNDIAERIGRTPQSLYYHVRELEKVGLLVEAGERPVGKRTETLYRLIAPRILIACNPRSADQVESAVDTAAAAFRMTEREMRNALESGAIAASGPNRNFHVRRARGVLSPAALRDINKHIDAIEKITQREQRARSSAGAAADADGVRCSLTIALLPSPSGPHETEAEEY